MILFELLTGELPFRGETRMLVVQILNEEPPSPRRLNARVPRDLETITLKCLEKEPDRRYASVEQLSLDLNNHLENRPVSARPDTLTDRSSMFIRRNRLWKQASSVIRASWRLILHEGDPCIVKLANAWVILNPGGGPTEDKPDVILAPPDDPKKASNFMNIRVADIKAKYEDWRSKGAEFLTPPIDRGAEIRCYMRDPDGYLIEVGEATGILKMFEDEQSS